MNEISIAFVTMVRDEPYFLPLWINHNSKIVPKEQLYILVDGFDQILPPEAQGCQILHLPRDPNPDSWDHRRWNILTKFSHSLLGRFSVVVTNDVDELLIADPRSPRSIQEILLSAVELRVLKAFAIEVIHRIDLEPAPIDWKKPILRQRSHIRPNTIYSKCCVIAEPVIWNRGGHCSDHPVFNMPNDLFLVHLRFCDHDYLVERQSSRRSIVEQAQNGKLSRVAGSGWHVTGKGISQFLQEVAQAGPPEEADCTFGFLRRRMRKTWHLNEKGGFWTHLSVARNTTFKLPEPFLDLF